MNHLLLPILLLASCTMRTYDCDVTEADIEATRGVVIEAYPDVGDVFDGMDVYCVDDTDTFDTCGGEHTEACTMWVGSGPYRGRMFLDLGDEAFDDLVVHEAQHWHLQEAKGDDCPTHEAACGWKD